MRLKSLLLVLVSMVTIAIGYAGKYTGDKVLRIFPTNDLQLKFLLNLEVVEPLKYDFWQYPRRLGKAADIHIKAYDFVNFTSILSSNNLSYGILVDDVQSLMDHQNVALKLEDEAISPDHWYKKYYPFDKIMEKLVDLVNGSAGHSQVSAHLFSLGKSIEGREQLAIKITSDAQSNKPIIFMNCGIHAREWVGPATCIYMIDQLLNKYDQESSVKEALDKIDFIIVPIVNPDGYVYSWTDERLWRKNRRRDIDHTGCIGVDLNRNFPYKWGESASKGAASIHACSEIFAGKSAESEPEVKNIADFLRGLSSSGSLKAYFDIHSYSQMWLLPWGYTKNSPPDQDELERVAKIGNQALYSFNNTEYEIGSSSSLLYVNTGTTKDFVYGELKIPYTYVLELRDKGQFGFGLPSDQILDTAKETFEGIKAVVGAMKLNYSTRIVKDYSGTDNRRA